MKLPTVKTARASWEAHGAIVVVDAIENGTGRVKVGDSVWNAKGPDAEIGARVRVTGISGTCLNVEPAMLPHSPDIG